VTGGRPLIFVVDDEEPIRGALRVLLRAEGFAVHAFASAAEALEALDSVTPDCVLTDYHMPEMDGRELISCLAKRRVTAPVIVMTGRDEPGKLKVDGCAHIIPKPFDAALLVTRLRETLRPTMARR
jgi:FixJ family two-component response regulator